VTATTAQQGAGAPPLPAGHVVEVPPGSIFQLLAAWLLMSEGAVALLFLPILSFAPDVDIPLEDIVVFGLLAAACLASGALLYSRWSWSWWVALAVAIGTAGWLVTDKGLTSWTEAYVGVAFAVLEVVLLVLGRRAAGRPEAMALASARIPFRLKLVLVWLAIFLVLALFFSQIGLDWAWMRRNASVIAEGVKYTLILALSAIVLAVILALLGSLGRLSKNPVAHGVSGFYTSFFRGTPLIVQLFLIYNAVPQIGLGVGSRTLVDILTLTPVQAGVIGLGLNYGAYMTEIFRAGIQAVGHGQAEAADALGMSFAQRMRRVVLPQATRIIIPPTGNEFIALMKDTALVGILGVVLVQADLFRRAQLLGGQDFRRLESLIIAAGMYWALTAVFTFFQSRLERRMSKGYVRAEARTGLGRRRAQFIPGGGPDGEGVPVGAGDGAPHHGVTAASTAPPESGIVP
jgi:polar amino acid transport system permease protein